MGEIPGYPAVGTPATSDTVVIDQGGATRSMTLAQVLFFMRDNYHRSNMIKWVDCFAIGASAAAYSVVWDVASLNTQGAGTNVTSTTPSHITLTTDGANPGDNEGTRSIYTIIQRLRLYRSEIGVSLGQLANTQFYWGWNTSATNAMVAAADKYVIVFYDVTLSPNWQIKVGDGTTEEVFTSDVVADLLPIKHEIWVELDGTVHWSINDTELDITGSITTNKMEADYHYLIVGQAQSVTLAAAVVVEIDYIETEKTKSH